MGGGAPASVRGARAAPDPGSGRRPGRRGCARSSPTTAHHAPTLVNRSRGRAARARTARAVGATPRTPRPHVAQAQAGPTRARRCSSPCAERPGEHVVVLDRLVVLAFPSSRHVPTRPSLPITSTLGPPGGPTGERNDAMAHSTGPSPHGPPSGTSAAEERPDRLRSARTRRWLVRRQDQRGSGGSAMSGPRSASRAARSSTGPARPDDPARSRSGRAAARDRRRATRRTDDGRVARSTPPARSSRPGSSTSTPTRG